MVFSGQLLVNGQKPIGIGNREKQKKSALQSRGRAFLGFGRFLQY